jgi:hypothetical protein
VDHVAILVGNLIAIPCDLKDSLAESATSWPYSSSRDQFGYLLFCLKTKQRISSTLLGDFVRSGLDPGRDSVPFQLVDDHEEIVDKGTLDKGPDDEEILVMKNVISKLRRIRKQIYRRLKARVDVKNDLLRYQGEVARFTRRFQENLSKEELAIWSEKVLVTTNDAENSKVSTSPIRQMTIPRPSQKSENVPGDEKIISPSREKLLEAVKEEEYLVPSLAEIPPEVSPAANEKPDDPDMMLRERWLRLKLFNQAWLNPQKCEQPPQLPTPILAELVSMLGEISASDEQEFGKVAYDLETESDEPVTSTEDTVKDFNEWYEAELRSKMTKEPKKKSFSNSHLPATSQVSFPSGLNSDNNIPSISAAYDSEHYEHECCSCMVTSSQQTNIQADHEQSNMQATTFMFMQAILVMLITLSEFIYCNLNSKPPHQQPYHVPLSNLIVTASVEQQSTQMVLLGNELEFRELVVLARKLMSQWILWMYWAVWMKVLSVMILTRKG